MFRFLYIDLFVHEPDRGEENREEEVLGPWFKHLITILSFNSNILKVFFYYIAQFLEFDSILTEKSQIFQAFQAVVGTGQNPALRERL